MTKRRLKIKNSRDKIYSLSLILLLLLSIVSLGCLSLNSTQAEGYSDYNNLEEKLAIVINKLEEIEKKLQKISEQNSQILININILKNKNTKEQNAQLPKAQGMQTTPIVIEGAIIAANSIKKAEITPITPKLPAEETEEEKSYNHAIFLLQNKRIDEAEAQFIIFINEFPLSELAGIAYYWLGEISFDKKDYRQASVYFLKGFRINPLGEKAAVSLLKLTSALREMKEFTHACSILAKLEQDFPLVSAIKEGFNKEKKLLERYCK